MSKVDKLLFEQRGRFMKIYITCRIKTIGEISHFMPTQLFFCTKDWEDVFQPGEDVCLMLEGVEIDTCADPNDPTVFHARWKGVDGTEDECTEDLRDCAGLLQNLADRGMVLKGIAGTCDKEVISLKALRIVCTDGTNYVELPFPDGEVEFENESER
jgi:hypothetical protein